MRTCFRYKSDATQARSGSTDGLRTAETQLLEGIMAGHVESLGMWDAAPVVGYEKTIGRGGEELVENAELTGLKIMTQSE